MRRIADFVIKSPPSVWREFLRRNIPLIPEIVHRAVGDEGHHSRSQVPRRLRPCDRFGGMVRADVLAASNQVFPPWTAPSVRTCTSADFWSRACRGWAPGLRCGTPLCPRVHARLAGPRDHRLGLARPLCIFVTEGDQGQRGTWVSIGVPDIEPFFEEYRRKSARVRQPPTNASAGRTKCRLWALQRRGRRPLHLIS